MVYEGNVQQVEKSQTHAFIFTGSFCRQQLVCFEARSPLRQLQ